MTARPSKFCSHMKPNIPERNKKKLIENIKLIEFGCISKRSMNLIIVVKKPKLLYKDIYHHIMP